ncbi:MAG: acetyl-CoA carboxylase biotin carboxyl carrier protein [Thermoanaerobaculia bacterium]
MLTFDQIKELVELVRERRLGVLEIEHAGFRLKIEGHEAAQAKVVPSLAATSVAPAVPVAPAAPVGPAAEPKAVPVAAEPTAAAAEEPAGEDLHRLKSPIVGTFYAAPSPDSDPYVKVGSKVKKGQVLCIIEAMKLMNEIESDIDGEIVEIHPRNAQPVEFGEPLFGIRAD